MNQTTHACHAPKLLHIEFLRFLCIWLVMFTHTSTAGFSLYLVRPQSFFFPLYLAVPFWVKTAVPIFFMISGALLLGKDEPLSVIFQKRVYRFVKILVIFSLINYVYFYHGLPLSLSGHIHKFFTLLYSSNLATAYYFLYIYVSFLLMLPLWRALTKMMNGKLYLYLAGLNLFFVGFMPILSFAIFQGSAELNYFINPLLAVSEPTFYFLLGYGMEHVLPKQWITAKHLTILGLFAVMGTALAGYMTYYHGVVAGGLTEEISERFYDSFLLLNASFVYLASKYWFLRRKTAGRAKRFLTLLGSLSFGVMLFEEITRSLTRPFFTQVLLGLFPGIPFIDAVLWISLAFLLGLVLTSAVKQISFFRHLI